MECGSGLPAAPSSASIDVWSVMLKVLPIPAALVDGIGNVIVANRWIDTATGETLLQPGEAGDLGRGLRFGADGRTRWRVRSLDDDGAVILATGEREDAGNHLLRKFFSSGESLFVIYDQWGQVIESNAAWKELLGYERDEVFGIDSWTLLPPDDLKTRAAVEKELRDYGRSEPTFKMRTTDGTYREVKWALHFDADFGRCFGIGRDVTEEGRMTAELERRAYTDDLTGLANRASLLREISCCLAGPDTPALLFCDLDRFKVVNDSLGHQAGDDLLAMLARRLEGLADGENILVARLGGDEFVGLIHNSGRDEAIRAAEIVLAAMEEPFEVSGRPIHISMSVGIAIADDKTTAAKLLGQADTAAYKAKQEGRQGYKVFDDAMQATVDRRFNVEEGLRRALDHDRLEVFYQPIVSMSGAGIIGAEALVRWPTEDGVLGPAAFLDVAEDAALMPRIGKRVMSAALDLGARLRNDGRPLIISVNISPCELAGRDSAERLLGMVERSELAPSQLLLEITESAVMNTDYTIPTLQRLRAAGIRIGLDDFGTGFSSLAHLRKLPIDVVKVDRSFMLDAVHDEVTREVTSSLIQLCDALGLDVILEGIETTDHAAAAEQMGGTMAQGFLFHPPMPGSELLNLLGVGRPDRRRPGAARQRESATRPASAFPGSTT